MFCEKCGHKNHGGQFCQNCGNKIDDFEPSTSVLSQSQDGWWVRLMKVIYIGLHIPLLGLIPTVWSSNAPDCYYYAYSGSYCSGSYGEAFWYSLLTLVIYLAVLRLIKIAVLYITKGQKPAWKKEFKKFF